MAEEIMEMEVSVDKLKELPPKSWVVRKCELYKREYKDCKGIRERFHQYFTEGEFSDCSQWKKDYDSCLIYRKTQDLNALTEIIKSELDRKEKRLEGNIENDIWEKRNEYPPPNWNCDLTPSNLQNKKTISYLAEMKKLSGDEITKPKSSYSICTIS
ncbi:UNVERIFIED_CONTAM: hypothetical protein RMT77_012823 [Armadillidium vulgare]|nr:UPF0545 protein C22orf39-like protein [Armadillidium vulgare]